MPHIEKLLPHEAPMILLDELIECSEESVHTQITPNEDSPFCEQGSIPSYIALEYMAQGVAAWNGYHAHQRQEQPKVGFLLGSRRLTLHVSSFLVGETLNVYGKCQYNDGEMASFECWVEKNNKRVAEATLNVYQPKDITQFNNET